MDLFSNWVITHGFDLGRIQDIATAVRSGSLNSRPTLLLVPVHDAAPVPPRSLAQKECLETLVLPAFEAALSETDLSIRLSRDIEYASLSGVDAELPYTVDRGVDQPVLIALNWTGSPDDVICLSHEVAHALQILLSNHEQMPPVAREVCAFLGELVVIAHAYQLAPDMFPALCAVWHRENDTYLGSDLDALLAALADPLATYNYRLNYPIARLAAVELFNKGDGEWLRQLFASGSDAMRHLPIVDLAKRGGDVENYLPPLPEAELEQPAIDAYRSLGAMALIDLDYWEGKPQTRIDDYYTGLLRHMQDRTAFVAVNDQRQPVGYATWSRTGPDAGRTLTRFAAPFGNHRTLQRALDRHLGRESAELIFGDHGASREQVHD